MRIQVLEGAMWPRNISTAWYGAVSFRALRLDPWHRWMKAFDDDRQLFYLSSLRCVLVSTLLKVCKVGIDVQLLINLTTLSHQIHNFGHPNSWYRVLI